MDDLAPKGRWVNGDQRLTVDLHPDDADRSPRDGAAGVQGCYRTVARGPDLLVLRRDGEPEPNPRRVVVAGEILGDSSMLDVLGLIAMSGWAGSLHVHGHDSHRVLGFDRGALCWTSSDHPHDRLKHILFRQGILRPSLAEAAMRHLEPGQRFGQLLVERGVIDRPTLFRCLQEQMRQTLYSVVLEPEGCFLFLAGENGDEAPPVLAHIPLHGLLLPAATRIDDLKRYRATIPSDDICPEIEPGVEVGDLDDRSRVLAGFCDGSRSIRELASETWLGTFETLKIVDRMVRAGRLSLHSPQSPRRGSVEEMIQPFSRALRWTFHEARAVGMLDRLGEEISRWLENRQKKGLCERLVAPDGTLSASAVIDWLDSDDDRQSLEGIEHSLQMLASFAFFVVVDHLPADRSARLARRVNRCLRQNGTRQTSPA